MVPPAPPEVRDFQLKPSGTQPPTPTLALPPAELPRVDVVPPAATSIPPPAPAATSTPPAAVDIGAASPRSPPERPSPPRQTRSAPATTPAEQPIATPTPVPDSHAATPASRPPASADPASAPALAPAPEGPGFPWLYAVLGAMALLGGLALLARRRAAARREEEPAPIADTGLVEEQAPAVSTAAPLPPPPAEARPRIALEFKPLMAGSTADQATVQFELALRNGGDAVARNVRIAIRMINAGPGQNDALAAFFRAPIDVEIHRPLTIPPGGRAETRRTAVLPKDAVQAISFQGKSLFIPVVAFNVLYEWGEGGQGQTATSFVVGRESNPPAAKMAPFRLDLGPRIYRTVGQRRNEAELVA